MTRETYTKQVYEDYMQLRRRIEQLHSENKFSLIGADLYFIQTKKYNKEGYEFAKNDLYSHIDHFPLALVRHYYIYEQKKLIGVATIYPSAGDEQKKTWVQLSSLYRVIINELQVPPEDFLLRIENIYLAAHKKSHGTPVVLFETKIEPNDFFLNHLLSVGYQIKTTSHSFQVPILTLKSKLKDLESANIQLYNIEDFFKDPNLETNLRYMINEIFKLQQQLGEQELEETILTERIIEGLKEIKEEKGIFFGRGNFYGLFEADSKNIAGYTALLKSLENQWTLYNHTVIGDDRVKRIIGSFKAILRAIETQTDSFDDQLMLNTSARDTQFTSTIEKLGFSLNKILYDLAKDGPDKDKIMFDSYATSLFQT